VLCAHDRAKRASNLVGSGFKVWLEVSLKVYLGQNEEYSRWPMTGPKKAPKNVLKTPRL
jgi:hypothetical protein